VKVHWYILTLVLSSQLLVAQVDTISTFQAPETNPRDTIPSITTPGTTAEVVKISDSGLESEISYGGNNQVYEAKENVMHLYGDAYVTYEDKELKAVQKGKRTQRNLVLKTEKKHTITIGYVTTLKRKRALYMMPFPKKENF